METKTFNNIAIAGDIQGINLLLKYIPADKIKCIIASSKNPQDINYLEYLSFSLKKKIILHLNKTSKNYLNFLEDFKNEGADAIICNSYSMLFDKKTLEIVNNQAFCFHESLLPKYKGLDSVRYAIMNNEIETGVTFFRITENINDGDIIYQEKINIEFEDTWRDVQKKLNSLKENILKNNISNILNNSFLSEKKIDNNEIPLLKISKKQLEILPLEMTDIQIYNLVRANIEYNDSAYFIYNEKKKSFSEFETYEKIQKYFSKYR